MTLCFCSTFLNGEPGAMQTSAHCQSFALIPGGLSGMSRAVWYHKVQAGTKSCGNVYPAPIEVPDGSVGG